MSESTLKNKPLAERKVMAVMLRKQGISPTSIARQLGLGSAKRVDQIVAEALKRDRPHDSALAWQDLELARLDDIYARLSKKMAEGVSGVERDMLRVMDYRVRLQASQLREPGRMFKKVQETINALDLLPADSAAAQSALDMATMIDIAMSMGTADEQRRAMNGMATMRNVLNDLGASPGARDELDAIARAGSSKPEQAEGNDPEKGAEVLSFMERAQQRMRAAQ